MTTTNSITRGIRIKEHSVKAGIYIMQNTMAEGGGGSLGKKLKMQRYSKKTGQLERTMDVTQRHNSNVGENPVETLDRARSYAAVVQSPYKSSASSNGTEEESDSKSSNPLNESLDTKRIMIDRKDDFVGTTNKKQRMSSNQGAGARTGPIWQPGPGAVKLHQFPFDGLGPANRLSNR